MKSISQHDIEKRGDINTTTNDDLADHDGEHNSFEHQSDCTQIGHSAFWRIQMKDIWKVEARGIARVRDDEKSIAQPLHDFLHMFSLWFSINLQAVNIVVGLLGPLSFGLGWVDCVCIVIFANALASAAIAYVATFGPESGNRTMIVVRYFMGYWPSKITAICNIVQQVGWGTIGCIITGQMITAVNGGSLSLAVGCVIAALCIGV